MHVMRKTMVQRNLSVHTKFTRKLTMNIKFPKYRQKMEQGTGASSPSAPARSLKSVFREKHRNTGFFLIYPKQFELQFCSRV